jgi:hypothetical protein
MLILVAILLIVLIVTVVFSVDVAYMQLTRTQLRSATDAAARAGAESLSRTQDVTLAREAAKEIAAKNDVASAPLILADGDVEFGRATQQGDGHIGFLNGSEPYNSVHIRGRRTRDSDSGAVSLFFGRLLGVTEFEAAYDATSMSLDRDICLVVDRSGSMKTGLDSDSIPGGLGSCDPPHPTLSRWSALSKAVSSFIGGVQETPQIETLGLVSYASVGTYCSMSFTDADIEAPLSDDYQPVISAIERLNNIPINGYTNIAAGIDRGIAVLTNPTRARPLAEKTMVLLTDGIYNRGRDPRLAAKDAAKAGIVIHTVTFSDAAEQQAMRDVADATGGNHYHAPDAATLDAIFREIALTLPVVLVH